MSRTGSTKWLALRARLLRQRGHVCHWCHRPLDPTAPPSTPTAVEVDHVVPVAVDPSREFDVDNCVLSCHPCNRSKGKRQSWQPGGRGYRGPDVRDIHGQRVLEPWRTCRVHAPILASCPHSGSLQ